jgi:hypothetical protein
VSRPAVRAAELPEDALLDRYRRSGDFTDCRVVEVAREASLSAFIAAFYNSAAFRPERWLLGVLLRRGANATDVASLAAGTTERFAAWTVEARSPGQVLLRDYRGKTRSWLMVESLPQGTQLWFGSAVVTSHSRFDAYVFRALLWFHAAYSHVLLKSAAKALLR